MATSALIEQAQRVGALLRQHGLTLAVAESCTGGLLGDALTDVPGSSDYFLGGVLAYSNSVKQQVLGVPAQTLAQQGAVSAQCAAAMANGVQRLLGSDLALSVTGIAGPGGGTPDKPVGLTWVHLAAADAQHSSRAVWAGDRVANKQASASAALHLLQLYLEERYATNTGE